MPSVKIIDADGVSSVEFSCYEGGSVTFIETWNGYYGGIAEVDTADLVDKLLELFPNLKRIIE